MAPLSPDNTARFRVSYTTLGRQHTMETRSLISPSAMGTLLDSFLTALSPKLYTWTVDVVDFAASGSSVFNPVTTGIEGNVYGSGVGAPISIPSYLDFVARSTGGRRLRMAVFGTTVLGGDYRFIAGEDADVSAARDILAAAGSDLMCIDGLTPVWKSYINSGFNAYWQRHIRP